MKTYLISQETLQSETGLSENIDGAKLAISIWNVQQTKLKGLICNTLYDELIQQKCDDTLTELNTTLLDTYITPYLAWASYVDFSIFGQVQSTASGYRFQKDDNSDPITDKYLQNLIKAAENKVQHYEAELVEFLKENVSDYPLYEDCCKPTNEYTNTLKITKIGVKNRPDPQININRW